MLHKSEEKLGLNKKRFLKTNKPSGDVGVIRLFTQLNYNSSRGFSAVV